MKKETTMNEQEAADKDNKKTVENKENDSTTNQPTDANEAPGDKAEEYLAMLQRLQADFDNYRKRMNQEREDWHKYSSLRLASSLLPILDNFDRALNTSGDDFSKFKEGIELIHKQLFDTLSKEGVKQMEVVGAEFNPNFHEAVMQGPSEEYADNIVCQELQKGYMFLDRVVRPAMVKVTKN